jgi:hypothetical protein
MSTKKRATNHRQLSEIAKNILHDIQDDFKAKGLSASALTEHYIGVAISQLQQKYCESGQTTQVDFDLALKELEDGFLIGTGPMVPYDNEPGSGIFIFAFFSKREYAYLTEDGYRAASQMGDQKTRNRPPYVHISDGTFHQSQIGIGEQVTQEQKFDVENDDEVIERLTQLFMTTGTPIDGASKAEITRLVKVTHEGDFKETKSMFQRLFGLASETVKQTAWGILTAIITKAVGL